MTREEFFSAHAHLAQPVAKRHYARLKGHGYQLDDLVQEALLALWRTKSGALEGIKTNGGGYAFVVMNNALKQTRRLGIFVSLEKSQNATA